MSAHSTLQHQLLAPFTVPDPGNTNTIAVDRNMMYVPVVTAAAETRTLAAPTKAGLQCTIALDVDGGTLTLTVTGGCDNAGTTSVVFDDAGDFITVVSIKVGATYRWQVVAADGVQGPVLGSGLSWNGTYLEGGPNAAMWRRAPSPADPRYDSLVHEYFNDFRALAADYDATNEWTYTETGGGGAAAITANAVAGQLTLTTDALDNDACHIVLNQMSFKLATGKKLWFETRLQVTTAAKATQSDWAAGLIYSEDIKAVGDNMPADGIVFHKDDGDTNIDISASDNGTNSQVAAVGTCAAATWVTLGFYFDGGATGSATVTP